MTPVQKLAGLVVLILALMASAAGVTWQVQEWRTGKRLAEQAGQHQGQLAEVSAAAAKQVSAEQNRRLALEERLATSDQQYTRELSDAQRNQALLCYC